MQKVICLFLLVSLTPSAHAYIDPGSSMLLLQGVMAAVGGALIFVRHPIDSAKNIFKKLKSSKNKNVDA